MNSNYWQRPAMAGLFFTILLASGCGGSERSEVVVQTVDENTNGSGEVVDSEDSNTDTDAGTDTDSDIDAGSDTGTEDTEGTGVEPGPDTETQIPPVQQNTALYRVTFDATWSAESHSINFPNDPHFSPLTGAVHSEQSVLWERGQIATDGIEQMAESGGTAILVDEIQAVVDEGRGLTVIEGGGVATSPGSVSIEITVTRDNPLVTLVSMLAPSPDWFVGVNGLSLLDDNGSFKASELVELRLYDAGTDGGVGFTSADEDTSPRSPISLVNSFPSDSNFLDGVPFVGQLVFERL